MANVADFYPEPSRNVAQTIPNAYALELGEAWYRRQAGSPSPFILKEIGAYLLFSHLFQVIGTDTLGMNRIENRILKRDRVAKAISIRRPDTSPYAVTLFETSYMHPETREWRGITPRLGFTDANGQPFFVHEQQAFPMMDWLARGPFLPPSRDYDVMQRLASDFADVVESSGPDAKDQSFHLEKQSMYIETLEMVADSLGAGRPEVGMETATDFIVPQICLQTREAAGLPEAGMHHGTADFVIPPRYLPNARMQ